MEKFNRSYLWHAERNLRAARVLRDTEEYDSALVSYQQSTECALKSIAETIGVEDKDVLQSHKVLRIATYVGLPMSHEERATLRLLGKAYFELRYPVDSSDQIEEELDDLGSPENPLLSNADDISVKCIDTAKEAKEKLKEVTKSAIFKLKLE